MEFELVEKPRGARREDEVSSAILRKHRALNERPAGSPQGCPLDDQAVCIPEQEDG